MPVLLTANGRPDELDREIERVAVLLRDLRLLRDDPNHLEGAIKGAPSIEAWSPAVRPVTCLHGRPTGHPRLPPDRAALTSPLRVLSVELGFVRTESRFWRLGVPGGSDVDG